MASSVPSMPMSTSATARPASSATVSTAARRPGALGIARTVRVQLSLGWTVRPAQAEPRTEKSSAPTGSSSSGAMVASPKVTGSVPSTVTCTVPTLG